MKEIDIKPKETQRGPRERDPKRPTPRHNIIKMPKFKYKQRILKAAREKQCYLHGSAIRLAADFSKETMQDRKAWHKIFSVMKTQDLTKNTLSSKAII